MSDRFTAKALFDELDAICADAWHRYPTADQSKELWRCIWEGDDSRPYELLGDSIVVLPQRRRVRSLAEATGRWWMWLANGAAFSVTLASAQAMFREGAPEMSGEAAAEYLRKLSDSLDGIGKRAVARAIAALAKG